MAIARGRAIVTIVAHRSEMGTGIRTCLPAVLADELGADWERVTHPAGDRRRSGYGSQNTDGSRSDLATSSTAMREVGATARTMLETAAAQKWGVEPSECHASEHAVVHTERQVGWVSAS